MRKNWLLLAGTTLLTLLVLELVLRFIFPQPPLRPAGRPEAWVRVPEEIWTEYHPELGWYHQKNKDAILRIKEDVKAIRLNDKGLRSERTYSPKKPQGILRLMVLGDSFVFGFGVSNDETFTALLETKYPGLEALNLGVAAYGLDQILLAYRAIGKNFESDYVFIGLFPEDFWRSTRAFTDAGYAKPYFSLSGGELELHQVPVPESPASFKEQFPEVIRYSGFENIALQSVLYRLTKRAILRIGKEWGIVSPDTTEEWILGRAILAELVREIKGTGAEPVFLVIPPDRWVRDLQKSSLHEAILNFAKAQNIPCLDLTPIYQQAVVSVPLSEFYIPGDAHWTARGHEIAAQSLGDYLELKEPMLRKSAE